MDDEYYELVEHPDSDDQDHWCIKLMKGEYAGIVYQYGTVGFAESPNDDGTLSLKFDYDVVHTPENLLDKEYSEEETADIINLLGNILVEIIDKDLETKREESNGSTGDDNFKGTVTRRAFYPKGDPLLKK